MAETVLFAVDLDQELSQPVGQAWSRLDVLKHAICNVVHAKRWANPAHKFGLITVQQDTCQLHPLGATSNADRFLEAVHAMQCPAQQQQWQHDSSSSSKPFDVGSLIAAVQPLQQAGREAGQPLHGGFLTPVGSTQSSSSSSNEQQQQLLRIVLVYCRSRLPAPVWCSHQQACLAVDCLHIHDKPQPGEQQQQLQEVYSTLEALVDRMALKAGHASLIYESTGKNLGKLLSCMSVMLSHPAQRPPQALAKPPVDLSLADLQPLPSDAANLASGVPIMPAAKFPAAAAGAWARPLSAGLPPAAADGSTPLNVAAGAAANAAAVGPPQADGLLGAQAAAKPFGHPLDVHEHQQHDAGCSLGAVVTGVPVGCVEGVPDTDTPIVGMDLDEGVVVGIDASRTSSTSLDVPAHTSHAAAGGGGNSSSSVSRAAAPLQGNTAVGVAASSDAELVDLAESLRVSAVEEKGPSAVHYPNIS